MKYFAWWNTHEDMARSFTGWDDKRPEGMATDDEVIFAAYGGGAYEGTALVVYERDCVLYEVNGSHCSCYGLEDQWEPEQTTWAALAVRKLENDDYEDDVIAAWEACKAAHS